MKKWLMLASGLFFSVGVLADVPVATETTNEAVSSDQLVQALPPKYQGVSDVKDMLEALEKDELVPVTGFQSINVDESVVYFRDECKAVFKRDDSKDSLQEGFVGPAASLVLDHIECEAQNP